jgi:hypothetical protein
MAEAMVAKWRRQEKPTYSLKQGMQPPLSKSIKLVPGSTLSVTSLGVSAGKGSEPTLLTGGPQLGTRGGGITGAPLQMSRSDYALQAKVGLERQAATAREPLRVQANR